MCRWQGQARWRRGPPQILLVEVSKRIWHLQSRACRDGRVSDRGIEGRSRHRLEDPGFEHCAGGRRRQVRRHARRGWMEIGDLISGHATKDGRRSSARVTLQNLHGCIHKLGQGNGSVGGFSLDNLGSRRRMVFGCVQLSFFQLLGHPIQHITVLGVDHGCDSFFSGRQQDIQDLVISELQCSIGHVDLQGRNASLSQFGELGECLFTRVSHEHVE